MNCGQWDEEIALWAGDDAVSEEFLDHLKGCGRCRAELDAMRIARLEWSDWTPRRRRRLSWWWGVAAAIPLSVWAGCPQPAALESLALRMPAAPGAPNVIRSERPPVQKKVMRREPAVTMKILTDDPEVVILLLGDGE